MQLNCCSTALVTREQALTPTAGIATTQHAKQETYTHVLLHLLLVDSLSSASARADPGYQVTDTPYLLRLPRGLLAGIKVDMYGPAAV